VESVESYFAPDPIKNRGEHQDTGNPPARRPRSDDFLSTMEQSPVELSQQLLVKSQQMMTKERWVFRFQRDKAFSR
jgi:hypothetical protein